MQNFLVRLIVMFLACAFGLLQLNAASTEVRKPVKPQLRIIDGSTNTAPRKIERAGKSDAARTWEIISKTKDIVVLDRFISQYPDSFQASLAAQRRGELQRSTVEVKTDRGQPPQKIAPVLKNTNLVLDIQRQLSRLGCRPGRADGKWGRKSVIAARLYSKHSKIVVETEHPNAALLASVRASDAGVCPLVCGAKFDAIGGRCVAKTCLAGQRLSSIGRCYIPKVTKTCGPGQKLSSKGRCYTPKTAKSCKRGERLSSRGVCFVPKARKVSTPRKPSKPARNRCSWCESSRGVTVYACGAKLTRLRASGNCN